MSKTLRARFEKGMLRPLEPLNLRDGEEVVITINEQEAGVAEKLYGIAKRRRPGITREEFARVLEELEDEDIH